MGGESRTSRRRPNPRQTRSLRESINIVRQYNEVELLTSPDLQVTPALIRHLHQIAMEGILPDAGQFRIVEVFITGADHVPPLATDVPELIRDFCNTVQDAWSTGSPTKLAALTFWRIGWIHPFRDGNGRTARAVAYLILCSCLGRHLPGSLSIPEQMDRERTRCIRAIERVDASWKRGTLDLAPLTDMIEEMLEIQLLSAGSDQ